MNRTNPPHTTPDFSTWDRATLEQFASETYAKVKQLQQANSQLISDFKDSMAANRALLSNAAGVVINTSTKE